MYWYSIFIWSVTNYVGITVKVVKYWYVWLKLHMESQELG